MAIPTVCLLMTAALIAGSIISGAAATAADVPVGAPTGLPILGITNDSWEIDSAVDDIHGFVYVVSKPYGLTGVSVYKIDIASNTRKSTLNLGSNYAHGIVLSPDGTKAYIAAWTEIIEIDLTTFTVVRTRSVLSSGESYMPGIKGAFAISPLGTALYVVDLFGKLRRVDLVVDSNVKEASICSSIKKLELSPDGNFIYCIGVGVIVRYDAITLQQIDLVVLNSNSISTFIVDRSGTKAYVAQSANSVYVQSSPLIQVDLATMSVDVTSTVPGIGTCALEIDSTNKWLYAGGCYPGQLSKINLATLTLATKVSSDYISDIESSSTGAIFVTTTGTSEGGSAAMTKRTTAATEPQVVNLPSLNNVELWSGSNTLSATSSSGLQVAYTSSTPSVCSLSGTSVNFGAYGRCTITGSQSGEDTGWDTAENISQSFDVIRQTVNFSSPNDVELHQGSKGLSASATSGGTVVFESSTSDVCTVSGVSVTLKAYGACTISANQTTNGDSATEVTQSFEVKRQSILFVQPDDVLLSKGTVELEASATSGGTVVFESSTRDVCTVSGKLVELLKSGDCTISASQITNNDDAQAVTKKFYVKPMPPEGELGVSINSGSPYTNSKNVKVRVVWPTEATEVRISNDGGFTSSTTRTFSLVEFLDWELDDSISGVFTKVIYARFSGPGINRSQTFSDDIILDTTAPKIDAGTASETGTTVTLVIDATDDISGVTTLEILSGSKVISKDYSSSISLSKSDLDLGVSTSGVRKSSVQQLRIRVKDGAGNWSVSRSISVTTNPVAIAVTTLIPSIVSGTSAVRSLIPIIGISKMKSNSQIAKAVNMVIPRGAKLTSVISVKSSKICKVSGSFVKGLRVGSCVLKLTMKPKKGKSVTKKITIKISK
jgi:hypothetical protein